VRSTGFSPITAGEILAMNAPTTSDDTTWGMLCHISALAGFVIPFGNIIGPVVVWVLKKDQSPFVDAHGKSAINFNISYSIYFVALAIIGFILTFILIGFLVLMLLPVLTLAVLILVIIAAIKASKGEMYEYPFVIQFLK